MTKKSSIVLVDLKAQYTHYKEELDAAVQTVMDHGQFIAGPEVATLENELAAFAGCSHAVSCSSGTDALVMMMMAEGIGPGDAVFVPGFTFTATAEVPLLLGAHPVFVDVDADDFNIDPVSLQVEIDRTKREGKLRPRVILGTDLFGLPCDYDALNAIANREGMLVLSDGAQSFGGAVETRRVGTLCRATGTSFFPAKPLGCYGDGGAVLTNDDTLAETLRSIRAHGKGKEKYDIVRIGLNARLDTIQAAVLRVKLSKFSVELAAREKISQSYDQAFSNYLQTPSRQPGRSSAWAQYTIKLPPEKRDAIAAHLKNEGIPTAVYYPRPMHLQTAYRQFGFEEGSLPICERLCTEVLSLPMHPFLDENSIERIASAIKVALDIA